MKEEKRKGRKGGRFSGFANWEKFPSYAIAKNLRIIYKKLQSLDRLEDFRHTPRSP